MNRLVDGGFFTQSQLFSICIAKYFSESHQSSLSKSPVEGK